MIDALLQELEPLVFQEKFRANLQWPPFHSQHEGVAVIDEEVEEAAEEVRRAAECFRNLRYQVYKDFAPEQISRTRDGLRMRSLRAAAELIQVAAMCDKFGDINDG